MRSLLRAIILILAVLVCSSCITMMVTSSKKKQTNNLDRKVVSITGKTVQRVGRQSALVLTDKNDVVCVIDDFGDYYDGMRIKGRYRRHGTFEYVFSDGARRFAPIFVRSKDYDKYMIIAEELGASREPTEKQKRGLDI